MSCKLALCQCTSLGTFVENTKKEKMSSLLPVPLVHLHCLNMRSALPHGCFDSGWRGTNRNRSEGLHTVNLSACFHYSRPHNLHFSILQLGSLLWQVL